MDWRDQAQTDATVDTALQLERGRKLYKYGMKDHVRSMVHDGLFRIGTLLDYQNEEEYGGNIGDSKEGSRTLYDDANYDFSETDSVPEFANEFFTSDGGGIVRNVRLHLRQQVEDRYLFCMSTLLSETLMKEFGYNNVIQIDKPLSFFHELTMHLRSLGLIKGKLVIRSCVYEERLMHNQAQSTNIDPSLLKDPRYAHQKEVRAIWEPCQRPITPTFIQCPPAAKFCTYPVT